MPSASGFNAEAHTMGLEFQLAGCPFTGCDLGLSGIYVEAEFESTLTRPDGTVIEGIRDCNRLPAVPKFQMAANATYSFPIDPSSDTEAFVTASFQHVGRDRKSTRLNSRH